MNDHPENVIHLEPGQTNERGNADQLNLRKDLQGHPATKGLVGVDEFSRWIVLLRPIPRPGYKLDVNFKPRPWKDSDETALAEHFISRGFKKVSDTLIHKVIVLEAEAHAFSPPHDLLDSLKWDGTPRLSSFFIDHCGVAVEGDPELEKYVKAVTRCFFIGVAARTFKPGCKHDCMLILEGLQGKLKSSLLRSIALRDEWFSDSLPHNLADKDARGHLPGKLIVEMSDISQFKKSQTETVKSFLSCQTDRYRPPYGRHDIEWQRRNVFVGTTNDDTYLADSTGNRRFWPLKITKIRLKEARKVIEQVYAEAVQAYRNGEQWWLTEEIEPIAVKEQDARRHVDPWEEKAGEFLKSCALTRCGDDRNVTTAEVLEYLQIDPGKRTKGDEMRAGDVLRALGCKRRVIWRDGKPRKAYLLPEKQKEHSE